tara:strand:- start:330 stop:596 length:267 start_codon:yes stop_codon:yes gene_type:complete
MSKKKSYMDHKNILSEGAIGAFFKGLFKGEKGMQRDVAKLERELESNVKDFNKRNRKLEKMIEKRYGKKVELDDITADGMIKAAKARG